MPSHPNTRKSVSEVSLYTRIQGTAESAPCSPPNQGSLAQMSPNDLVRESRPGKILSGPFMSRSPTRVTDLKKRPPFSRILRCQSVSEGLWSRLRLMQFYPFQRLAITLESPRFAMQQACSIIITTTAHEPLRSQGEQLSACRTKVSSQLLNPSLIALIGSSGKLQLLSTKSCKFYLRNQAHRGPPCPSQRPKNEHLLVPRVRLVMMVTLSQLQLRTSPRQVLTAQTGTGQVPLTWTLEGRQSAGKSLIQEAGLADIYFILSQIYSIVACLRASPVSYPGRLTCREGWHSGGWFSFSVTLSCERSKAIVHCFIQRLYNQLAFTPTWPKQQQATGQSRTTTQSSSETLCARPCSAEYTLSSSLFIALSLP